MSAVAKLIPALPARRALMALGASHATWYRRRKPHLTRARARRVPPLALSAIEREAILTTLNSPRFADATPYTAWARLLDEGVYLASVRTFTGFSPPPVSCASDAINWCTRRTPNRNSSRRRRTKCGRGTSRG